MSIAGKEEMTALTYASTSVFNLQSAIGTCGDGVCKSASTIIKFLPGMCEIQ